MRDAGPIPREPPFTKQSLRARRVKNDGRRGEVGIGGEEAGELGVAVGGRVGVVGSLGVGSFGGSRWGARDSSGGA